MTASPYIDQVYCVRNHILSAYNTLIVQTLSGVFYLPVGRGKALLGNSNRIVDAVIGGWEISPLYVYTQGVPCSPGTNFIPGPGVTRSNISIHMHDLLPDSAHTYKRLQKVSPFVAYYDNDTLGPLRYSPAYTSPNGSHPPVIRLLQGASNSDSGNGSYAPQVNTVYWGVRQPAYDEFSAGLSKRFIQKEDHSTNPFGCIQRAQLSQLHRTRLHKRPDQYQLENYTEGPIRASTTSSRAMFS